MDLKEQLRQAQSESLAKRQEELAKSQQEYESYLQSEQYQRDQWEHYQDLWEKSFAKRGLKYQRQPFVSALERQQQEEQAKRQEFAFLEEKIKALKGGS